jgi:hypothetical protein
MKNCLICKTKKKKKNVTVKQEKEVNEQLLRRKRSGTPQLEASLDN